MPAPASLFPLIAHPRTPAPMIRSLEAAVVRAPDGALSFRYRLFGDIARLRVPEPADAGRRDGLWQHTCFEAFVAGQRETAYREFNFSPSGQWAVYDFSDYRRPVEGTAADCPPPQIAARRFDGRLEVDVRIEPAALPERLRDGALEIGLCAVAECVDTIDDAHSYWALRHPPGAPDFHRRDGFALALAALR